MSISEQDIAELRKQGDLKEFLKQTRAAAHAENKRRRTLVLRYPDLADQLKKAPHRHTTPQDWTGYIPPATDCTGAINTTPCRPALLALVAAAEQKGRAA
ncbi:hypothetical protein STHAL_18310 [Streptomyces halstedii]|uniref:Uncharacterized protein n=1 Tax=Streptomyces halstedii TaxID=1944 RepID=A0ABS6TTJ1_STRHA|nr:hypothetical protein [Streptomyces halstedii]MBV7671406.1 hypothetical protein [Streptomyces halstedii]